jgi:hypothetical protein
VNTHRLFITGMLLLVTIFSLQSYGEIKSGMIEFRHPTSEPFNVDFSDQLIYKTNMKKDSVSADSADLIFTNPSIDAPYGIQKVSIHEFYEKYIKGKSLFTSSEVLPYLDTAAKEFKLSNESLMIPDTIQNKVQIETDSVFLATTREGGHVLLMQTYRYIGGYDRFSFYWVYQSSGDTAFYKNELISPVDSLTITPNIFSGRPDPVFTIRDKNFATALITRLSFSFNKLLNPSIQILAWDSGSTLGSFSSVWIRKIASNNDYPAYHFTNDNVFFHQMPQEISSFTPPALKDNNYYLLRFIIKFGILNNIETSDMYGVIRFKDLFPENILTEIDTCSAERFRQLISGQTKVIHRSVLQLQQIPLCKATLRASALTLETVPGFLDCVIVRLDGTVVKRINGITSGVYKQSFDRVSNGVFFVKGTLTTENGVASTFDARITP